MGRSPVRVAYGIASFLADLAVILGIGFAVIQITHSDRSERRRFAIEAVNQTRSAPFLKAYANLKNSYKDGKVQGDPSLLDDANYLVNVYDHIALLYINDLADRCIVKESVYSALRELSPIWEAMSYPGEYRENIKKCLVVMGQDCK
jgi:hypothetical protein